MHCVFHKIRHFFKERGRLNARAISDAFSGMQRSSHGAVELSGGAGGANRDRTDDLLLAKQALSQLSYGPNKWWVWEESNFRPHPYQGCALTN